MTQDPRDAKCNKVEHWDEPEPCQLCKPTPTPLTREQVEKFGSYCAARQDETGDDFYAVGVQLRRMIEQQAQEIARLKEKWQERRANLIEYYEGQLTASEQKAGRLRELLGGMCLALEQEIDRTSRNEAGRGPTNYREYIEAKQALRETAKNDTQEDPR